MVLQLRIYVFSFQNLIAAIHILVQPAMLWHSLIDLHSRLHLLYSLPEGFLGHFLFEALLGQLSTLLYTLNPLALRTKQQQKHNSSKSNDGKVVNFTVALEVIALAFNVIDVLR